MYQLQDFFYNSSISVAAVICIYVSVILFIRGKNSRPRQMLAITTFMWGLMYLFMIVLSITGRHEFPVLCGKGLFSSHIFICLMFLFPLEVLLPGWLKAKRILCFLSPMMFLSLIYFTGLYLTGQRIVEFQTFGELFQSIGEFGVWFRFILLGWNFCVLFMLLRLLDLNKRRYLKWEHDNFSDLDKLDVSWLTSYKRMMISIFICYVFVGIWGTAWIIIIHTLAIIINFSILFYKAFSYENTYIQDLDASSETLTEVGLFGNDEVKRLDKVCKEEAVDTSFSGQMPIYVDQLKAWMETEKPYLYKEFKLQDVGRVLPLNRTYLSRLFNEGYNQNFSEVVRNYRIEYAKDLLIRERKYPIYRVADMCGFSSVATFSRAFQNVTGESPKQFREDMEA